MRKRRMKRGPKATYLGEAKRIYEEHGMEALRTYLSNLERIGEIKETTKKRYFRRITGRP